MGETCDREDLAGLEFEAKRLGEIQKYFEADAKMKESQTIGANAEQEKSTLIQNTNIARQGPGGGAPFAK